MALLKKMGEHDDTNLAAAIAFYAFLALFPLVLGLLAVFSQFMPSEDVLKQLIQFFSNYLPGSPDVLQSNIADIIRFRGALGAIGIIGLMWSATGAFSAVTHAVNRAWEIPYKHPFYIKKPKELAMVAGTGILFLLSFGSTAALSLLSTTALPLPGFLVNLGTLVIGFILSMTVFMLINKLSPVLWISWRYVWPGAILSTVLFEAAKTIFVIYLNTWHAYDKTYGSLTSIIVVLIWIYYSAFILLLGAEFNSMLFRMKREGEAFDKSADKVDIVREI
jgi:membrane protein